MNKVIIIGLLVLLVGGVVSVRYLGKGASAPSQEIRKANGVVIKEGVVSIDVKGKLSMVDLKIKLVGGKMGGFESNKEIFNSELLNRIEEDGSIHVVLGVLKPTTDLPDGQVIVGKMIDTTGGQLEVEGKVTIPSEGTGEPKEIEVYSEGVNVK